MKVNLADGCWVGKSMGSFSGPETAGFVDSGRKKRENMKFTPPSFWSPRTQGWEQMPLSEAGFVVR